MPKVIYTQMYERAVEVEVTSEEYNLMHQTVDMDARSVVEAGIVDRALATIQDMPMEFVMAQCTDEDDEEIFDI
jgi:hypothetical protein